MTKKPIHITIPKQLAEKELLENIDIRVKGSHKYRRAIKDFITKTETTVTVLPCLKEKPDHILNKNLKHEKVKAQPLHKGTAKATESLV